MPLEDFFDRIKEQYETQLPFVVYRKPNESTLLALLQKDNYLYLTKDFKESGFVFSPFEAIENTVILPLVHCEHFESEYAIVPENNPQDCDIRFDPKQKECHLRLIDKSIGAIEKGTLQKVVVSRFESVVLPKTDITTLLKRLLNRYRSAFVYCWYHPKVGLWLGATPETLIKIEGRRFSIMALAGTQVFKGTEDVIWQNKETEEQQFVTDFIVDKLKPFVDELKVSDTQTVKAGSLLHLRTMITAQLKPEVSNIKQVISVLHPTPAVCGLPKQEAKQFILNNENYDRGFYTGFLGEINIEKERAPYSSKRNIENRAYAIKRKTTQLYVNLRCMQIINNKALIYVGGGITKSSNPANEWEETISKSIVIKSILY